MSEDQVFMSDNAPALVLASGSAVRADIMRRAGLTFHVEAARIDEEMIREGLEVENASSAHVAEVLAELKAQRVSTLLAARGAGEALVIAADQVLDLNKKRYDKPRNLDEARANLKDFSGKTHQLITATVVARQGAAIWRNISRATLTVRELSDEFIDAYIETEGEKLIASCGCYFIEGLGVHLFADILGDQSTVQGLPILPLLDFLRANNVIPT